MSAEIAWAAGLFEGEGSIHTHRGRRTFLLRLAMTDEDVVRRFALVVGAGTISRRAPRQAHYRAVYEWSVWGEEAVTLLRLLLPWLGARRTEKGLEALEEYGEIMDERYAPRVCPKCGTEFVPQRSRMAINVVYCSVSCRLKRPRRIGATTRATS